MSVPGTMDNSDVKVIALLYLFLTMDHQLRSTGIDLFEQFGASYKGFNEAKGTIIEECEKILKTANKENNQFNIVYDAFADLVHSLSGEPKSRKHLMLCYLELGTYRNDTRSENKYRLIELLTKEWEIDGSIVDEMRDTCETLYIIDKLLITGKQKNRWLLGPKEFEESQKNTHELSKSLSDLISIG
jgi:hypothetical protein